MTVHKFPTRSSFTSQSGVAGPDIGATTQNSQAPGQCQAQTPEVSTGSSGARGVEKADKPQPLPASVAEMLRTGQPNMHPHRRHEQLQWARSRLYADKRLTPYQAIVACRAVILLSYDAGEIAACQRIKSDAERTAGWRDQPLRPTPSEWAEISMLVLFVVAMSVALWLA